MFLKHPGTYIQATINNYYMYFYPQSRSIEVYSYEPYSYKYVEKFNSDISVFTEKLSYLEQFKYHRNVADNFRNQLSEFPIVSFSMKLATYTWLIILMLSYSFYKKNKNILSFLGVFVALSIMFITAPVNGYYSRYIYPLILNFPLLIAFFLKQIRIQREQSRLE